MRLYQSHTEKKQKQENIIDNFVKSNVFRSERKRFNWKTHYFFCGEVCVVDKKHSNCHKGWHKVGTLSFQNSILMYDVWRWFSSSIDLVASDAIYHGQCESNFFMKICISTTRQKTEHTPGHCTDKAMKLHLNYIWLDQQTKLFTVSKLHAKVCSFENDLNVSSLKWMKKQLEEQLYQKFFFSTDEPGCSNVVCFTDMASIILSEQWHKDRKEF